MALDLLIFLPVAACLFWIVVHFVMASRTDTFGLVVALLAACGIFLFSEGCRVAFAHNPKLVTASALASQLAAPCIIPLLILYMRRLMRIDHGHPLSYIWIVVPVALFTAAALLHILEGDERTDALFHFITVNLFHVVLGMEILWFGMFELNILRQRRLFPGSAFRFFFRRQRASLVRLQMFAVLIPLLILALRLGFANGLYGLSLWIPVCVSLLMLVNIFMFSFFALFGTRGMIEPSDLRNALRYNYGRATKSLVVEAMMNDMLDEAEDEALKRIQERIGENLHIEEWKSGEVPEEDAPVLAGHIFKAVASSWDEDSLISRFQHLMMDEQLFLQPRLSLDDVAEKLNTNKTYISKLVNNSYNLGFPELVNTMRVDYAEQYIMAHRGAKQNKIAAECGFLSASSFNTTFKKVTGVTPKVWIASLNRQNKTPDD